MVVCIEFVGKVGKEEEQRENSVGVGMYTEKGVWFAIWYMGKRKNLGK